MSTFCSECKCCEAQESMAGDPKPLCVFCEDGVPCLGRQRAVRSVVTPAPARLLTPPETKARKPRNPNSPWRGNAGLHLSDNAPAKPAPSNSAVALQDEAVEPQQVDEVPTAGKDLQEEKETNVRLPEEERALRNTCACGTMLRKDNSDGVCKKCRKAGRSVIAKVRKKLGRPRNPQAAPPPQFRCQSRDAVHRHRHDLRDRSEHERVLVEALSGRKSQPLPAAA
jgi:hypothetical protein